MIKQRRKTHTTSRLAAVALFIFALAAMLFSSTAHAVSFTNVAEPMGTDTGVPSSSITWGDYDKDGTLISPSAR